MHILIISSEPFDHRESSMYGIFQKHQANHLQKNDFTVGVLSPLGRSLRFLPTFIKNLTSFSRKKKYDFNVCKNYLWNPFPKFKRLEWFWYRGIGHFLYYIYVKHYGKPDIIHAHNTFHAGRLAVILKEKYKIPVVLTEHSSIFLTKKLGRAETKIVSDVMNSTSQLIGVSSSLANELKRYQTKYEKRKVEVVHNVLDEDFEKEAQARSAHAFKPNKFTFFNLAGLTEIKNHRLLINAFSKVAKELNILLKIGGYGPLYNELNDLINILGMNDHIFLLGHLNRYEVQNELRGADCFVLTSNHETFGVVLIEALSFGLPLISTNCGGPEEIVNEQNGFLVNVNSEPDLINSLRNMVTFARDFNPDMLKEMCLEKYSGKKFIENMASIYNRVLVEKV